ncbi:MAG: hypothetical protein IKS42_07985 [Oscillospiraceae bacterium]|nr:hypothetical protein [Oscillospiraceae bacterium]
MLKKTLTAFTAAAVTMLSAALPCSADAASETAKAGKSAGGSRILVALGDSYSAGEGNPPFYASAPTTTMSTIEPDWVAHRSPVNWSGMLHLDGVSDDLSQHRDTNWFFVADSGAIVSDLYSPRRKEFSRVLLENAIDIINPYSLPSATLYSATLPAQFDVFDQLGGKKAEYVTMTMGGNDMGFADVVTDAITHRNWFSTHSFSDKLDEKWKRLTESYTITEKGKITAFRSVEKQLEQAYKDIANKAGPQAKIIIAGYPYLMAENDVVFPAENATLINKRIQEFNDKIKEIVNKLYNTKGDAHVEIYFADVAKKFEYTAHAAFSGDSYLNEIMPATYQDLSFPSAVSASSMHPNRRGVEKYAEAVQEVIKEIEQKESNNSDTGQYAPGFAIEGTWRVTSDYGFGQAQPGAYVQFDGEYCNLRTEDDFYELTMDNDRWYLDTLDPDDVYTAFLVDTFDDSHIRLTGVDEGGDLMMDYIVELERVSGSGGGSGSQYEDGSGGEFSGGSVPSGTYVMKAFGVVVASYTFYEGNRISMNTVGITGTGTYVLEDGYIIVTYTTSLDPNGKQYKWQTSFSMHGDTVVIGGDELVRQ